jgi:hypothetical protein
VTGAQECHGWAFEIGSIVPLTETEEGGEGEAILSRRGLPDLYKSGSMRSFLDSDRKRVKGAEGQRVPKRVLRAKMNSGL